MTLTCSSASQRSTEHKQKRRINDTVATRFLSRAIYYPRLYCDPLCLLVGWFVRSLTFGRVQCGRRERTRRRTMLAKYVCWGEYVLQLNLAEVPLCRLPRDA